VSTVLEIEAAIAKLPPDKVQSIADWLTTHLPRLDSTARREALRKACGIWKDRTDLPDVRALRAEWERR
jgi:hypothetical protein